MKSYFTIVENNLSPSYKKACWEIAKLFETDGKTNLEVFSRAAEDITSRFPELHHTDGKAAQNYLAPDIGERFVSFSIDADRKKIIEVMRYVIAYTQQNNFLLLAGDYLYYPNGTMTRFSKVTESKFPPSDEW